jgi:hypothetical protein
MRALQIGEHTLICASPMCYHSTVYDLALLSAFPPFMWNVG